MGENSAFLIDKMAFFLRVESKVEIRKSLLNFLEIFQVIFENRHGRILNI